MHLGEIVEHHKQALKRLAALETEDCGGAVAARLGPCRQPAGPSCSAGAAQELNNIISKQCRQRSSGASGLGHDPKQILATHHIKDA